MEYYQHQKEVLDALLKNQEAHFKKYIAPLVRHIYPAPIPCPMHVELDDVEEESSPL